MTLSMSVAGASSKNFTIGAGGPRIPCTRPAGYLHTRSCLLTARQQHQILDLFSGDEHVALEVTWSVYQSIIDAYRDPNKIRGKALMQAEIDRLSNAGVPSSLTEIITLGRTLKRRSRDILAYFDHPHTSNGPTEAINGRLDTYADPHSGSATSPTTSPAASSKQEDSDPNYTLNYEEPPYFHVRGHEFSCELMCQRGTPLG